MWPQSLVAELASRRCIVFLGAGASAGCKTAGENPVSPPTWLALLNGLKNIVQDQNILPTVDLLIDKEKYLDAAEVLMGKINRADFAAYMRRVLAVPRYQPSDIHNSVLELDPKIVITTNYDDIYDAFCRAGQGQELYNVCKYYESHLVSDLRSPVRQIVKAHGCITDPSKIVLTRSQYFRERQEHPNFYKVLDALFLTNTLFFVGYGISDPDIQLMLENSNITFKTPHPHYALVEAGMNEAIKAAYKEAYNIEFIEFEIGNFAQANELLRELVTEVATLRETNPI